MVKAYNIMEANKQTVMLNYLEKKLVSPKAKTVNVSYNQNGFIVEAMNTRARMMNGGACPKFIEENTPGGTDPVYFEKLTFEENGNLIKLGFRAWGMLYNESGEEEIPAYIESGKKRVSEFAEKFGLNVKNMHAEPEKGSYSALLSLETHPQKGETTTITV